MIVSALLALSASLSPSLSPCVWTGADPHVGAGEGAAGTHSSELRTDPTSAPDQVPPTEPNLRSISRGELLPADLNRSQSGWRDRLSRRTAAQQRVAEGPELNRRNGSLGVSLGGQQTTASMTGQTLVGGTKLEPGVFQFDLGDPGTGWQESVVVGEPIGSSGAPAPALVMFHAYDLSELDCYTNGSHIFNEARNRGWYVIAPLGAHQVNFGIPYAQENIEYALTFLSQAYSIDQDRIYGIGFSMGGGGVMSYASRHLDPDKPRFAAVVNHTGAVSTANAYWNTTDTFVFDHEDTFNGSPATYPFLYSQSSCMDIDQFSLAVNPNTDLARNLNHIPVLNFYADFDTDFNLVAITVAAHMWLAGLPGMNTALLHPPIGTHSWGSLNENTALGYLTGRTLQTPTTGEHFVLADRETKWFHFYVYQDAPGAFTPFRWNYEYQQNRLTIDQTENLQRVVVDTVSLTINTAVNLELVMGSNDGTGDVVTLSGYAQPPQQVLRNGQPTSNWTWDNTSASVTLTEANASGGSLWRIRP